MPADLDFFRNQTEREQFKRKYPIVFNYLFEGGYGNRFGNIFAFRAAVKEQLETILNDAPTLFNRLIHKGVFQGRYYYYRVTNQTAFFDATAAKDGEFHRGDIYFPWQPCGH